MGFCYNGTDWQNVFLNSRLGDSSYKRIYEEAMIWNISSNFNILTNDYFDLGDNISCNITGYNGTFNLSSIVNKTIGQQINFSVVDGFNNNSLEC